MKRSKVGLAIGAALESGDAAFEALAIEQIRDALAVYGTQAAAAKALGVGLRTMQRWVANIRSTGLLI